MPPSVSHLNACCCFSRFTVPVAAWCRQPKEGDYDVEIPAGAPPGAYRIRVGRFEDDSLFGCSGRFHIMHDLSDYDHTDDDDNSGKTADEGDWARSYSFTMSFGDDAGSDDTHYRRGDGGAALDDDDWWMATDFGDDDAPPPAKGGGGLWGDEDEEEERHDKEGRDEHASRGGGGGGSGSPYSFSYDFVWATEDWYN